MTCDQCSKPATFETGGRLSGAVGEPNRFCDEHKAERDRWVAEATERITVMRDEVVEQLRQKLPELARYLGLIPTLHDGAYITRDGRPVAHPNVRLWRPDGNDRVDGRAVHRVPDPQYKTERGCQNNDLDNAAAV